jgi:hypothetical protein
MTTRTRREAFWERSIGLLEIIGGLIGVYAIVKPLQEQWEYALSNNVQVSFTVQGADLILLLFVGCFPFLCIYAGIQLFRGRREGRLLSLVALALQIPAIAGSIGVWKIGVGLSMTLFWAESHGMDLGLSYGTGLEVALGPGRPLYIGINILPLLLMVLLLRLKKMNVSQSNKVATQRVVQSR